MKKGFMMKLLAMDLAIVLAMCGICIGRPVMAVHASGAQITEGQDTAGTEEPEAVQGTVEGKDGTSAGDSARNGEDTDGKEPTGTKVTVSGNDTGISDLSATDVKDGAEVIKTGETNLIPFIISLAVIAAGAGCGYMIYKKKQQ